MKTLQDASDYYLRKLRAGDFDSAFHGLIDLDPVVIQLLIAEYRKETSMELRSKLLRIIIEFRTPHALPLLDEAVRDRRGDVYKVALDGLVSLASTEAVNVLESVVWEEEAAASPNLEYIEWVREALGQTRHRTSRK